MTAHVLPTLPEPDPSSHGHDMPPAAPSRYDAPQDIGTGQAAFAFVCVVLALSLAMGILAIDQLKSASGLIAHTLDRAATAHMEAPQARAIPASATR